MFTREMESEKSSRNLLDFSLKNECILGAIDGLKECNPSKDELVRAAIFFISKSLTKGFKLVMEKVSEDDKDILEKIECMCLVKENVDFLVDVYIKMGRKLLFPILIKDYTVVEFKAMIRYALLIHKSFEMHHIIVNDCIRELLEESSPKILFYLFKYFSDESIDIRSTICRATIKYYKDIILMIIDRFCSKQYKNLYIDVFDGMSPSLEGIDLSSVQMSDISPLEFSILIGKVDIFKKLIPVSTKDHIIQSISSIIAHKLVKDKSVLVDIADEIAKSGTLSESGLTMFRSYVNDFS